MAMMPFQFEFKSKYDLGPEGNFHESHFSLKLSEQRKKLERKERSLMIYSGRVSITSGPSEEKVVKQWSCQIDR